MSGGDPHASSHEPDAADAADAAADAVAAATAAAAAAADASVSAEHAADEAEPEEECGFCVFMKGGGCKDEFEAWSKCVDDHRAAGDDFAAACHPATAALQECMRGHADYYKDFLADADALVADAALAGKEGGEAAGPSAEPAPVAAASPAPAEEAAPAPVAAAAAAAAAAGLAAAETVVAPADAAGAAAGALADAVAAATLSPSSAGAPALALSTPPADPRFPATNQARHCYTAYNMFHKCMAEPGASEEACGGFARTYRSLCPSEWVDKWNEQREAGTWPGKY